MTVTFLGTGTSQGVPVIGCTCAVCLSLDYRDKRLRTSVLIETGDQTLIFDTGPDFRQQMLREDVRRLDAVIFTHAHRDHTAGLDDVRAYNFMQNADMPVYGTDAVLAQLRIEYAYAFATEYYPGIPRLSLFPIAEDDFSINGLDVTPLPVMHLRLPVLGFRIGDFSYVTDANFIPDETKEKMKGTRTLVLNALQREAHISHFNLEQALRVVEELNAERAYFTHISHKLGLHADVSNELPPNVFLAYDGLKVTVDS